MSNGKAGRPKDPYTYQIIEALHEKFPKFTRSQMSQIRNPAYGLQMAQEAVSVLEANGILPPNKNKKQSVKKIPQRKKQNRFTVRLNDTQKVRFFQNDFTDAFFERRSVVPVRQKVEAIVKRETGLHAAV